MQTVRAIMENEIAGILEIIAPREADLKCVGMFIPQ